MPNTLFGDMPRFVMRRSLIAWHSKIDRDVRRRMAVVQRWSEAHGCPSDEVVPRCLRSSTDVVRRTCGGLPLQVCEAHYAASCSEQKHILWDELPPLQVTDGWSLAQLAAFARFELNATTEGELRRRPAGKVR